MADLTRKELEAFAEAEAQRQGVPPQLVKAMIDVESNWQSKARSEKDAAGLMQLIPATAREMGVTNPNDPIQNIRGGVAYLKQQINRFGDLGLALAAYNWGPRRAAQLEENPRGTRIPDETLAYVPEVFARMRQYGQMLAPSAFTLALYPLMKAVLSDETLRSVRGKLGLRSKADIARDLRTGNVPGPPAPSTAGAPAAPGAGPAALPPEAPPIPPESAPGLESAPGTEVALGGESGGGAEGAAPVEGELMPRPSPRNVRHHMNPMDAYLRAQFGPLADLADPFPTTYDSELEQMLDRS
jgi:hypothetical protein